jgi:hypothetical protein
MRRRPQEDDGEQHDAGPADLPAHDCFADHRRKGSGGAADHDVLRRPALQPHRVDHGIKEDGEGQQPRRQPVGHDAEHQHRADRQRHAEGEGLLRGDAACRDRALGGARHHASMSASYHMLSAPEAPAPTAMASSEAAAITGWTVPGSDDDADQRGEDHQRHHARLQQLEIVADIPADGGGWDGLGVAGLEGGGHERLWRVARGRRSARGPRTGKRGSAPCRNAAAQPCGKEPPARLGSTGAGAPSGVSDPCC